MLADNHRGEHLFPPLPARRSRRTVQEAEAAAARVRAFGMAPPDEYVQAGWAATEAQQQEEEQQEEVHLPYPALTHAMI